MSIFKLSLLVVLFGFHLSVSLDHQNWWSEITKYVATNMKIYQVVFLVNEKVFDTFVEYNKNTRKAMGNIPYCIFTFQEIRTTILQNDLNGTSPYSRSETLFLILTDSYLPSDLQTPVMVIKKIIQDYTQPRCLFIFLSKKNSTNFSEFLQWMWTERFLDVTVIENSEKENDKEGRKLLQGRERKNTFIYFYNPFRNITKKLKFGVKFDWFPEKLHDLNGYVLNGGLYNRPPTVHVSRNSTYHVMEYSGWSAATAMTMSELMNFRLNILLSKEESIGKYSCGENMQTGILKQVENHDIQYVMVDTATITGCLQNKVHDDIIFGIETFLILVPIIKKDILVIVGEMLLLETALLILLLTLILWIIFYIIKRGYWQLLDILLLVLQDPSYGDPSEFKEQIILGWVQITGILYSSAIMAGFTAVNFQVTSGHLINTLNDVNNSEMRLIADPNIAKFIEKYNHGIINHILDDSIRTPNVVSNCLNNITSRKIACLVRSSEKVEVLHLFEGKFGLNFVKVLEESLWQTVHISVLEENSPYSKHFNKLIDKFLEVGLKKKWTDDNVLKRKASFDPTSHNFTHDESNGSSDINGVLLLLIGIGFSCSTFVFFCEIVISRSRKIEKFLLPLFNDNTKKK